MEPSRPREPLVEEVDRVETPVVGVQVESEDMTGTPGFEETTELHPLPGTALAAAAGLACTAPPPGVGAGLLQTDEAPEGIITPLLRLPNLPRLGPAASAASLDM